MKNRIKKFYEENKTEIRIAVVSFAFGVYLTKRKLGDQGIAGVNYWRAEDGMESIRVDLKNGQSQIFDKTKKSA